MNIKPLLPHLVENADYRVHALFRHHPANAHKSVFSFTPGNGRKIARHGRELDPAGDQPKFPFQKAGRPARVRHGDILLPILRAAGREALAKPQVGPSQHRVAIPPAPRSGQAGMERLLELGGEREVRHELHERYAQIAGIVMGSDRVKAGR